MAVVVRNHETYAEIRARQVNYWATFLVTYIDNTSPAHFAAVAPTANDGFTAGYRLSQIWYNTATNKCYIAANVTDGAAVWTILN